MDLVPSFKAAWGPQCMTETSENRRGCQSSRKKEQDEEARPTKKAEGGGEDEREDEREESWGEEEEEEGEEEEEEEEERAQAHVPLHVSWTSPSSMYFKNLTYSQFISIADIILAKANLPLCSPSSSGWGPDTTSGHGHCLTVSQSGIAHPRILR